MSKEIIEKLDAIEAKQAESVAAVEAKIPAAVEAVKAEMRVGCCSGSQSVFYRSSCSYQSTR